MYLTILDDKIKLFWKMVKNVPTGRGYGVGQKYIVTGIFIDGKMQGDVNLFCTQTGNKLLTAELVDNRIHGKYTFYKQGQVIEEGLFSKGTKYFHLVYDKGDVVEYGFVSNNKLHGEGVLLDRYGNKYTSPHWENGKIHGMGAVEDKNGDIIYYGTFLHNEAILEYDHDHPYLNRLRNKSKNTSLETVATNCFNYLDL
jgi:antitoxin component YwqK of YwqJK toxin-antitoxin module